MKKSKKMERKTRGRVVMEVDGKRMVYRRVRNDSNHSDGDMEDFFNDFQNMSIEGKNS